ncbi:MAG TPA: hypothetical protein VGD09_06665, partial [Blastococcus sp.]
NSSQGGGSKDTWVISPPREASDTDEPDLTRIEFTAADLPDDPPGQDPGPLNDTVVGQSQQQQQSASVQGPGASSRALGGSEVLPLDPRKLEPSLRARPAC